MTSASERDVRQCSNCPKTATHTCKACRVTPNATDGQVSSAWYCGAECQKAHWTEHKAQCKAAQARQVLYRAGALAQQIFYLYTKTTFMWSPGRIQKIGTTWLIHPKDYTGKSQLMPFPYESVPDARDQEALLAHQSCSTAVSQMHNVFKALLKGLYLKIDEVSHLVKGTKHDLRRVYMSEGRTGIDSTDYVHTSIRVTLKNGEIYAVDIAGAQYGWHEPVTPWQLYNTSRVREIKDVAPFGGTRTCYKTGAANMSEQRKWIHSIKENFAERVDCALARWQRVNILSTDLLRLPEHEFQKRQTSLLGCVDEFMQRYKAFQDSYGGFNVSGGFKDEGFDREFTSSALGTFNSDGVALLTPIVVSI